MATRRFAKAIVSHHNVPYDEWMEVLRNQNEGAVPRDHVHRIAKTVLKKCDPRQYLLSHATIVASVDTYAPRNAKTGTLMNQGVQIDVRWPEYRIKPEVQNIINNNGDAWDRNLLLSTYRSFIGAQNYCEHIQIPELSKGFIVDAIARDLGPSCYIDILVATDRKHDQLVHDILDGKINALSMGCISAFTTCTKCGNVATDESQLCPCIMYEGKHTEFYDEDGIKHKIAELIGHSSVQNSNQFIEASWVANPAFKGAVRRNFLNADMEGVAEKMSVASEISLGRTISMPDGIKKAASIRTADSLLQSLGLSGGGQEGGQQAPPSQGGEQGPSPSGEDQASGGQAQVSQDKEEKPKDDPLAKKLEEIESKLMDSLMMRLEERMLNVGKAGPALPPPRDIELGNSNLSHKASVDFNMKVSKTFGRNKNLVRWACDTRKIVMSGSPSLMKKHRISSRDLIVLSWVDDSINGRNYSPDLYRIAMSVGPMKAFNSQKDFVKACEAKAKRSLNASEKSFLIWKAKIANLAVF